MKHADTYAGRLASAMEEAGFGGLGGQSRLAADVDAKSQAINQALSGASAMLATSTHCRVAHRLGVRAIWLSEGKGERYEPLAPPLLADVRSDRTLTAAEGTAEYALADFKANAMTLHERRLIAALRLRPPGVMAAVTHLVLATRSDTA